MFCLQIKKCLIMLHLFIWFKRSFTFNKTKIRSLFFKYVSVFTLVVKYRVWWCSQLTAVKKFMTYWVLSSGRPTTWKKYMVAAVDLKVNDDMRFMTNTHYLFLSSRSVLCIILSDNLLFIKLFSRLAQHFLQRITKINCILGSSI